MHEDHLPARIQPVQLHQIIGEVVPPRQWAAPGLVPMGAVTILAGDSGIGKSTICQQVARAVVLGEPLWGRAIERGSVVLVSYEDDRDEILRRFQRLGSVPDSPPLWVLGGDQIGHRGPLVRGISGGVQPTDLYGEIRGLCAVVQPRLVVVDPLANAFAGDENDRTQAGTALQLLRRLAPDAAVLVVAHSSLSGLQSGKGGSGSTGWRAAARAQLNLIAGKEGHQLALVKSNYSALESVHLRFDPDGFKLVERRPRVTAEEAKPWEAMGVSRRTYYQRKKDGKA